MNEAPQTPLRGSALRSILLVVGVVASFAVGFVLWRFVRPAVTQESTNTNTATTRTNTSTNTRTNSSSSGTVVQPVDADRDGLTDADEANLGTDPTSADSDGDGLPDRAEVSVYRTKPRAADSDGDSVGDGEEVRRGTNPNGAGLLLDVGQAINAQTEQP